MKLAVIVVSYNTRDLLRQCLHSVYASAARTQERLAVEVIVVDNASHDGSPAMVTAEFPQTQLIASQQNLGYTGGNNLALRTLGFTTTPPQSLNHPVTLSSGHLVTSSPDYVLILNPDTEVSADALWQMAVFLYDRPDAGVCGARLQYGDGRFQHGAFRFPSLFQVALDFFPLMGIPGAQRIHNSRWNGRYPQSRWFGETPFAVDFVLGAAMMVRGEAIQQVGGLDDGFFLYCEEMDWCLRMKQAGWGVYAAPTAQVIHHEGQSSRQVRWSAYERLWRSRFRFYQKYPQVYSKAHGFGLRRLVQVGLSARTHKAKQQFAQGMLTGTEVAAELSAYAAIRQLAQQDQASNKLRGKRDEEIERPRD